jgi:predicted small secreted protein
MARKIMIALGIATMTLTAAACNTVRGAGDDLESAADAVDEEI